MLCKKFERTALKWLSLDDAAVAFEHFRPVAERRGSNDGVRLRRCLVGHERQHAPIKRLGFLRATGLPE